MTGAGWAVGLAPTANQQYQATRRRLQINLTNAKTHLRNTNLYTGAGYAALSFLIKTVH